MPTLPDPIRHPGRVHRVARAICLWGLTAATAAAFEPDRYRYARPVTPPAEREELAALSLDSVLWNRLQPAAPDLRLAADDGREVPFLLRKAVRRELRTERVECLSTVDELRHLASNRVEIVLSLATNAPAADEVVFDTPLRDFEKRLTVWGVKPDGAAEPLVEQALIFDYSRFADVRRNSVPLPENNFRVFKLLIETAIDTPEAADRRLERRIEGTAQTRLTEHSTVTTRPFRMDAVTLYDRREVEHRSVPVETNYALNAWTVTRDETRKTTTVEIDTFQEPLTALTIDTVERNFSRKAAVLVPVREGGIERWRPIGQALLSRLSFRSITRDELSVPFAERQSRRYRLEIADQDDPPLTLTDVRGRGPVWQAVFLAGPDRRYTVHYGAPAARAARHDTSHISRLLASEYAPVAFALGDETENPAYREGGGLKTVLDSRLLFALAVIVMVAALAATLARAWKTAGLSRR